MWICFICNKFNGIRNDDLLFIIYKPPKQFVCSRAFSWLAVCQKIETFCLVSELIQYSVEMDNLTRNCQFVWQKKNMN